VPRDAGAAFFDTVTRKPRLGLRLELAGGLLLAGGALLSGPSHFAARVRATVSAWVAVNKRVLRTGTVVAGFLLLLASNHPTARLVVELLIAVLVVLLAIELLSASPRSRRS
jgi:hypothetical protein